MDNSEIELIFVSLAKTVNSLKMLSMREIQRQES